MPGNGHSPRVKRAAVVIHPGKHDDIDAFRATVNKAMADLAGQSRSGWQTRPEDTGERAGARGRAGRR